MPCTRVQVSAGLPLITHDVHASLSKSQSNAVGERGGVVLRERKVPQVLHLRVRSV